MSQFRPYAPNDKDWVVGQYKKKHGDDWGKDLVELMEADLTGKTEEAEEQPTGISTADHERITKILHAQFNGFYSEGETVYLEQMSDLEIDVRPFVIKKFATIAAGEPKLYLEIIERLKKTFRRLRSWGDYEPQQMQDLWTPRRTCETRRLKDRKPR